MTYKVVFKDHAAAQTLKRIGLVVPQNVPIDISGLFIHADTYVHRDKKILVDAFVYHNANKPIVFIVAKYRQEVMTTYIGKKISGRNTPFVDELYRKAFAKNNA